jgi:NAD(P)-dependent dehydrogenase (short-subunit alcohol dehydrogenase family)
MTAIGKNLSGVLTDVSRLDDIDNLYRTVAAQKRKTDIVVANAGFVETQGNSRHHPIAFRQNLRYQRALRLFHRSEGAAIGERRRLHHSHRVVQLAQGISIV